MKKSAKRIASALAVLCSISFFFGCSGIENEKPNESLNGSDTSLSSETSSTGDRDHARVPADPTLLLEVPSTADIPVYSLSEALANFSLISGKAAEGTPEEIVKTLLERNVLCFAVIEGKCWTYDEYEHGDSDNNYEYSQGIVTVKSDYIRSVQQIDDLFYGTYTEEVTDYFIHYIGNGTPEYAFYEDDVLYADLSQILQTSSDSFETPTYAAVISASDDEIIFGRYYEQRPENDTLQPNNYHFRAVNVDGEWRLENLIIDAPAYRRLYDRLIQTNRTGCSDIEKIAMTEVGNFGGEPYWGWYMFDSRIEWCAAFVSWCYYKAGQNGPYFAGVNSEGVAWFMEAERWADADYRDIAPGDSIFFDWDLDGSANHVGLVIGTDGKKVYTIEGNRCDTCQTFAYDLDDPCIFGYGLMEWD